MIRVKLPEEIFRVSPGDSFNKTALKVFRFQSERCKVYSDYLRYLRADVSKVTNIESIPFLPISFFKEHNVYSGLDDPEAIFISSGTTGMINSRHSVMSLSLYEESFTRAFRLFYGDPGEYAIMGLLPSYLEREGSSLIYMVKRLIELSGNRHSGFFLNDDRQPLPGAIDMARNEGLKVLLIGVTFALLDLAEANPCDLSDVIIMETGGMKGRRKEMIREEVHAILKAAFNIMSVHSEYGMTELLSQAYSKGEGLFKTPPWMKVLIRDSHDPLSHTTEPGSSGGISVIDLANIWSCSFIATSDLGRMHEEGVIEILGRFDNADIRGCNLLVS